MFPTTERQSIIVLECQSVGRPELQGVEHYTFRVGQFVYQSLRVLECSSSRLSEFQFVKTLDRYSITDQDPERTSFSDLSDSITKPSITLVQDCVRLNAISVLVVGRPSYLLPLTRLFMLQNPSMILCIKCLIVLLVI